MLSAAKVRQHGMQDSRWVVKDKIAQHRGVIDLYERDRRIQEHDLQRAKERYSRDIKQLRKDIVDKREELDTAVCGDKQFVRNALQEHRRLQIAHKNSKADKVLECILQENFNKRKQLDRITYAKQKKMEKFKILQEEAAEMRDRILYDSKGKLPTEKREQTIANYVQCANVKKNAALAIKGMYMKILDILKKDSAYFSSVLDALKQDCTAQGRCLVGAAEMGQLAMEYLDDRKFEFEHLEKEIKKNMKERERSLKMVKKEVKTLTNSFPRLIHKDESPNLEELYDQDTDVGSVLSIHGELEEVMETCKRLQRATLVPSFEEILPRLMDQDYQYERMVRQLKMNSARRDQLLEDRMHAELILDSLKNIGQDETAKFINEKKMLREQIQAETKEEKQLRKTLDDKGRLIICIRDALQHINFIVRNVSSDPNLANLNAGGGDDAKGKKVVKKEEEESTSVASGLSQKQIPTVELELDKLVQLIKPKVSNLSNALSKLEVSDVMKKNAKEFYHQVITQIMKMHFKPEVEAEAALIEFEMDDPSVPTYKSVKKLSKFIVDSQVSEFDVPT